MSTIGDAMTEAGLPRLDTATFFDVGARRIARVYAEALLNGADGQAADVVGEVNAFVGEVLAPRPELEQFLVGPEIGRDVKAQALRQALAGQTSELFLNFLLVLNEHDRLDLLPTLVVECQFAFIERQRRRYVLVSTAVPLPDDQRERLLAELRGAMALEPMLVPVVDPDMLGGMTVQIGDWLYDASVRSRLDNIRKQLLESSSHAIQSRRNSFRSD
jgi:F-type H+-transporting ATPase subunit delta